MKWLDWLIAGSQTTPSPRKTIVGRFTLMGGFSRLGVVVASGLLYVANVVRCWASQVRARRSRRTVKLLATERTKPSRKAS